MLYGLCFNISIPRLSVAVKTPLLKATRKKQKSVVGAEFL